MEDSPFIYLNLVRHGETDENVRGIVQGQKDTNLNDNGRQQAKNLANSSYFNSLTPFDLIFSSDLSRAFETCEIISTCAKQKDDSAGRSKIIKDVLLRERKFGELEGKPLSELRRKAVQSGKPITEFVALNGEAIADVNKRIRLFLNGLFKKVESGQNILIVSHGGIIRQMILELATKDQWKTFDKDKIVKIPPNTSLNRIQVFYRDISEQEDSSEQLSSIIATKCLNLHDLRHLDEVARKQALEQKQINDEKLHEKTR